MRKKFTRILVMLVVIVATNVQAFAYDFEYQGIYYSKIDNNTVAVTSAPADNPYRGKIEIPASVPVQDGMHTRMCPVIAIGDYAFQGCPEVTEVIIPEGVTEIGEYAFEMCESLTEIIIPAGVESIGDYAFRTTGLASVAIPGSVTIIGNEAFAHCVSLQNVELNEGLEEIGGEAFKNSLLAEITIPESVRTIGGEAFKNCNLTEVTIPDGVTSIGAEAFATCSMLATVTFPNGITEIANGMFLGCNGLNGFVIPESVTAIGAEAFAMCHSLTEITIPASVESIGDNAFVLCDGLTEITCNAIIPPALGDDVFDWVDKTIPLNVPEESLADYMEADQWKDFFGGGGDEFSEENAEGVNIYYRVISTQENTVEVIESPERYEDYEIYIPETVTHEGVEYTVTKIGDEAFEGNYYVMTIGIPSTVTEIGNRAFAGCETLGNIICDAIVPPTCGEDVFEEDTYICAILSVPEGSVDTYQSTDPWSEFYEITKVEDSLIGDAVEVERYDISGLKISKPVQGVNIVRYSNGAVRKEVR